jgi:hypothetical protein
MALMMLGAISAFWIRPDEQLGDGPVPARLALAAN